MAGYMPERVFEVGALTIAYIHASTGKPIEAVAQEAWAHYSKSYLDDNILAQWIEAADHASTAIDAMFPNMTKEVNVSTLVHLKNTVTDYNRDGSKRAKRLLGGTWFNKEKKPNYQRAQQFVTHIATYHVLLMNGSIK
jgi:hypothetical protein